ncbi:MULTISPECIES: hypothetical protein [unclassified Nocardia]|uniref:hypothetical protein n=1 Tax=unclassified Nocardia TaxID=2637762 RepID=UPI001CE49EEC|nr:MULTISPECIES: hypothetical protein [unclassified Nocardia]
MDAHQALGIAAGAQQAAARNRTPGWYPPLFAALWAIGAEAFGTSVLLGRDTAWFGLLNGVWATAWVAMIALTVVMARHGGVVRRPSLRPKAQRWIDNAPDMAVVAVAVAVGLTAGVGWAFIVAGVLGGASGWFRLARMHR